MPIAVMMESSENTMSMTMICMIAQKNTLALDSVIGLAMARLDLGMNFVRRLRDQEGAAADQDDVAPRQREVLAP